MLITVAVPDNHLVASTGYTDLSLPISIDAARRVRRNVDTFICIGCYVRSVDIPIGFRKPGPVRAYLFITHLRVTCKSYVDTNCLLQYMRWFLVDKIPCNNWDGISSICFCRHFIHLQRSVHIYFH